MLDTEVTQWPLTSSGSKFLQDSLHNLTTSYPLLDRFNLLQPGSSAIAVPHWCSHLHDLSISSYDHMARKAKIDPKRQVYTRPAARRTIKPKSREPERKSSSVDDYDVYTIQPKKPQGQSTQPGRVRDRGHRPSYDIHGQSEDTDDSDEEFVPFPSRAAPKTERIYPESKYRLRQRGRITLIISQKHQIQDSRLDTATTTLVTVPVAT